MNRVFGRHGFPFGLRWGAFAGLLLLAVVVSGCRKWPDPIDVNYPDDPRVLHGEWHLRFTDPTADLVDYVYAPGVRKLLVWFDEDRAPDSYELSATSDWRYTEAYRSRNVDPSTYDPLSESFYWTYRSDGSGVIVRNPADNSEPVHTPFALPDISGRWLYGAGRGFLFTADDQDEMAMYWVDGFTGDTGGPLTLPQGVKGWDWNMTKNGSLIVGWDASGPGTRVSVIDTTAATPAVRTFSLEGLGAARYDARLASASGRWFVYATSADEVYAVDLESDPPTFSELDLQLDATGVPSSLSFTHDTPELFWLHAPGELRTLDLSSGTRTVIPTEARMPLGLDRTLDQLFGRTEDHQLLVEGLSTGTTRLIVGHDAPSGGVLALTAEPLDEEGDRYYSFSGAILMDGGAYRESALNVAGAMNAHWHRYIPAADGLKAQMQPPPLMKGRANVTNPATGDVVYTLDFYDGPPSGKEGVRGIGYEYRGSLYDPTHRVWYSILLYRDSP